MLIRLAANGDASAVWAIMEPIIRAGETYRLPREMSKEGALAYWLSTEREVFVAEDNGEIVGTYGLQANQKGGGAHVANCGYMTAVSATGRGCLIRRALSSPPCRPSMPFRWPNGRASPQSTGVAAAKT